MQTVRLSPLSTGVFAPREGDAVFSLVLDSPEFGTYESAQVTLAAPDKPTPEARDAEWRAVGTIQDWMTQGDTDRHGVRMGFVPRNERAVELTEAAVIFADAGLEIPA